MDKESKSLGVRPLDQLIDDLWALADHLVHEPYRTPLEVRTMLLVSDAAETLVALRARRETQRVQTDNDWPKVMIGGSLFPTCPRCSALVTNVVSHARWHAVEEGARRTHE